MAKKGVVALKYGKELSHFAADKFFEFDIPSFSTGEIPLLLNEGGVNGEEVDFAFVDQHLLNEKMEEWKRKREKAEEKLCLSDRKVYI